MGVALGYALLGYDSLLRGLDKLEVNEAALAADLDARLGSAGRADPDRDAPLRPAQPLRALKELTRGKAITREAIAALHRRRWRSRPPRSERLQALTPASYTGAGGRAGRALI